MRWAAIAGQLSVILVAYFGFKVALEPAPLAIMLAVEALSNIALSIWWRADAQRGPRQLFAAVMAFDILCLTALLAMSGATANPFALLYIVHVTLATVTVSRRYTWALTLLSIVCYAALFLIDAYLIESDAQRIILTSQVMRMQREGMWASFVVTSLFIVYFVTLIREQLAAQERELKHMVEIKRRQEHLASLATLSAGAAHELSTPLSTIALVAREVERALLRQDAARAGRDALVEDAQLIRSEVAKCQKILQSMASEAGASMGEMVRPERARAIFEGATQELGSSRGVRLVEPEGEGMSRCAMVTPRALSFAIQGIVRNAQEAAQERQRATEIALSAQMDQSDLLLIIEDQSGGMPEEVARRATEPFFSTKETGRGMGLGLFLASTLCDRLGGGLELTSIEGAGTRVVLRIPAGPCSEPLAAPDVRTSEVEAAPG